jgi:type VI secretion system secreted protein Hcp
MNKPFRSLLVAACLGSMILAPWSEANAALNAYFSVKGEKQGEIKGSVTKKGHEGDIAVVAISHEIVSPRDHASGLPTGKRQHKPFVITKELDKSTPLLYRAMIDGERLPEVELSVFAKGDKAAKTPLYTIKLVNATISQIRMVTQDESKGGGEATEISFTYQKIEWTWTDGGITANDDWEAPLAAKPKTAPKAAGKG